MPSNLLFLVILLWIQLSYQPTHGIPLSEFYPFGEEAGDNVLQRVDDGSSPVIELISSVFPFYDQEFHQLYVSC